MDKKTKLFRASNYMIQVEAAEKQHRELCARMGIPCDSMDMSVISFHKPITKEESERIRAAFKSAFPKGFPSRD